MLHFTYCVSVFLTYLLNDVVSVCVFNVQCSLKKVWYSSDGLSTSVETPATSRAAQLQNMYNVLQNEMFDQDERIDILMTVKNTVKVKSLLTGSSQ